MALREFNFFDFSSIIGPGVVTLVGFTMMNEGKLGPLSVLDVDLGELGVLLVVAYVLGYLMDGLGSWLEQRWWDTRGTHTSVIVKARGTAWLPANKYDALYAELSKINGKLTTDNEHMGRGKEWNATYEWVKQIARSKRRNSTVPFLLGIYCMYRNLSSAFLVLAAWLAASTCLFSTACVFMGLLVMMALCWWRMLYEHRRYIIQLYIDFLP